MFVKLWLSVILFAYFVSAKTYFNYNSKDFIQALQVGCPYILNIKFMSVSTVLVAI